MKKGFYSKPVCNEKYIKIKILRTEKSTQIFVAISTKRRFPTHLLNGNFD